MTPRVRNDGLELSWFAKKIFSQFNQQEDAFDLTGDGPLFKLIHPALIKCRHFFETDQSQLVLRNKVHDWYVTCYKNLSEAESLHPMISIYGGFPYHIFYFLQERPQEALINFNELGSVFISKTEPKYTEIMKMELHHYQLPLWLDYALSNELWQENGKWTRFHKKLHEVFKKLELLLDNDHPGFYSLKKEAQWIENHGFQGKIVESKYQLTLPWDFSLSGLNKLVNTVVGRP